MDLEGYSSVQVCTVNRFDVQWSLVYAAVVSLWIQLKKFTCIVCMGIGICFHNLSCTYWYNLAFSKNNGPSAGLMQETDHG